MSDPYHTSWPPRPWIHRSERPLSHIGPAQRLFSSAQPLSHIVPSHRILDPTFNRTPMRIAILQKSFPGVLPRSPPQVESFQATSIERSVSFGDTVIKSSESSETKSIHSSVSFADTSTIGVLPRSPPSFRILQNPSESFRILQNPLESFRYPSESF